MSTPDDWEFRLSPDRRQFAVWEPGNEPWFVPVSAMQGRFVNTSEMDALGWTRFTPMADGNRADGLSEAADAVERLTADGEHDPDCLADELRILARRARAEFTETQQRRAETPTASPSNRRALVHNAITDALSAAGDWVPLSVRAAAARAALAEVDAWHSVDVSATSNPGPAAQRADRIVAYTPAAGRPGNGLHCRRCTPTPRGDIWTPVTSEELPDGGTCTTCGTDVLIDLPVEGS